MIHLGNTSLACAVDIETREIKYEGQGGINDWIVIDSPAVMGTVRLDAPTLLTVPYVFPFLTTCYHLLLCHTLVRDSPLQNREQSHDTRATPPWNIV